MWFPKRLVPILAIAPIAVGGGWLFADNAPGPSVAPAPSDAFPTPIPASSREDTPVQIEVPARGNLMRAQGTWQDPPPGAGAVPAWTPIPPWYPPSYDGSRYRDARRSMYGGRRDPDHRRSTSWFDSICPSPKRRRAWPDQRGYSRQTEQLDRREYWDTFTNRPPLGITGPLGW